MIDFEQEPAAAVTLFGDRIELARRFTADLAREGELRGLIGPLELPRLWSRHVLNSALVAPLLRPGRGGDVGSGAGLPGLLVAIARPEGRLVLIEPMGRRATRGAASGQRAGGASRGRADGGGGGARPRQRGGDRGARRGCEARGAAHPGDGARGVGALEAASPHGAVAGTRGRVRLHEG